MQNKIELTGIELESLVMSTNDSVNVIANLKSKDTLTEDEKEFLLNNTNHVKSVIERYLLPDNTIENWSNILGEDINTYTTFSDVMFKINSGTPINDLIPALETYFREQDYQEWMEKQHQEYEDSVYEEITVQEEEPDEDGNVVKEEVKEKKLKEDAPTFDEWLNEEVVVQEAVLDDDGNIIQEEVKEKVREYKTPDKSTLQSKINNYLKPYRLKRLEKIFTEKTIGLKKLAIDKPWMTDREAINDQYRVYEEMYKAATNGFYDEDTNNAIIQANETAKQALAPVTLLLNNVRWALENMINNGMDNIDQALDAAENIKLSKEELTEEKLDQNDQK
jgi:hypothetical protein